MINSNNLANRLNKSREGKEIPKPIPEEYNKPLDTVSKDELTNASISTAYKVGYEFVNLFRFCFNSSIYGYSFKLIFMNELSIFNFLVIGMAFNTLTSRIFNLFHKNK